MTLEINDLDVELRLQLRQLHAVYENPTITATWKGRECERLEALGLAKRDEYNGFAVYSITPAGITLAEAEARC